MRKRTVVIALSLVITVLFGLWLPVWAQQPKKVVRIGYLTAASVFRSSARIEAFRQGLREFGYVEGKDIVVEYRYAEGKLDLLPALNTHRKRIVDFALTNRFPSVYGRREYVNEGGLMYYGADITDSYRRVAYYVDKILKGAKPTDLPVEQPTKFEFIIHLKTAKQIGLTIPPNVLARADRVIR